MIFIAPCRPTIDIEYFRNAVWINISTGDRWVWTVYLSWHKSEGIYTPGTRFLVNYTLIASIMGYK